MTQNGAKYICKLANISTAFNGALCPPKKEVDREEREKGHRSERDIEMMERRERGVKRRG